MNRIKLKNGMEYILHSEHGKYYLYTHKKEKADSTFERWKRSYRKEIDPFDPIVEECYNMLGYFEYDTGVPDEPKLGVLMGDEDLENNIVYLYDGTNREGWEQLSRFLSRTKVDFRKVSTQYIRKDIYIRNGREYNPPLKEKHYMSKEKFVRTYIGNYGENM